MARVERPELWQVSLEEAWGWLKTRPGIDGAPRPLDRSREADRAYVRACHKREMRRARVRGDLPPLSPAT